MRYIAMLLFLAGAAWGNACANNGASVSGNFSSASTWTSCGATFPHDGDTITWNSTGTLTIDANIGTAAGGGLGGNFAVNNGTVTINCTSPRAILFHSTGTTGNTNAWGFLVPGNNPSGNLKLDCSSAAFVYYTGVTATYGTTTTITVNETVPTGDFGVVLAFNTVCTGLNNVWLGTNTGTHTFTVPYNSSGAGCSATYDGTATQSPVFVGEPTSTFPIFCRSSITGQPAVANVTLKRVAIPQLGSVTSGFQGFFLGDTFATDTGNLTLDQVAIGTAYHLLDFSGQASATAPGVLSISHLWIMNIGAGAQGISLGPSQPASLTVSDSTISNGTGNLVSWYLFHNPYFGKNLTFSRNAVVGTSSRRIGLFLGGTATDATGTGNFQIFSNLCLEIASPANNDTTFCIQGSLPTNDTTTVVSWNTSEHMKNSISPYSSGTGAVSSFHHNFGADDLDSVSAQGVMFSYQASQTWTGRNNVVVHTGALSSGNWMELMYATTSTPSRISETVYSTVQSGGASGGNTGLQFGESALPVVSALAMGNLVAQTGWGGSAGAGTSCINDNNVSSGGSTYKTVCPGGVGVCQNWTAACTHSYYTAGTAGTNWQLSGVAHPNARYGDLDTTSLPRFLNPNLRTLDFARNVLGLSGTDAVVTQLFANELAKRSGYGGTCNVCGLYYDGSYGANGLTVLEALNQYIRWGFLPLNHWGRAIGADSTRQPDTPIGQNLSDMGAAQRPMVQHIPPVMMQQ